MKRIAIIGAGAAGCFAAIEIKRRHHDAEVHVFESGRKALAKVAITGGGRCNLTNSFADYTDDRGRYRDLALVYPRGDKMMRKILGRFSHRDTWEWFEREGVKLVTQEDECVFPQSQDAMEIVNTLLRLMKNLGVRLHLGHRVADITYKEKETTGENTDEIARKRGEYQLIFTDEMGDFHASTVIVTTGGGKSAFLSSLGIQQTATVPSLFTFNIEKQPLQTLMGTVVEKAQCSLAGTPFRSHGPLLWTHWGVSGPAVLKLSSYAARHLEEHDYKGTMLVNWCDGRKEDEVRGEIMQLMERNQQKNVTNVYPDYLTQKHWTQLLDACSIPLTQRWGALNKTHLNRLVNILTAQPLSITGRCHYKEEFVTCGGVALSDVNPKTLEHKHLPGLYFAGEVLDVDAITGGFNLQAAWSMAYVVSQSVVV